LTKEALFAPYSDREFLKALREKRLREIVGGKVKCLLYNIVDLEECVKCKHHVRVWHKPGNLMCYVECGYHVE